MNGVLQTYTWARIHRCPNSHSSASSASADSAKGPYVSDAIRRAGMKLGERRQNESGMLANRSGPSSSGQLNLTL